MKKRHWRPDWRLWLFSICLFPLLLWLAFWQFDRAHEKEQQLARWEQLRQSGWQDAIAAGLTPGQPVQIAGHYRPSRQWLLDNRTRSGRSGYEVLTVFQPDAGPSVLVNRGWLAAPLRRSQLPQIDTPTGHVMITGRIATYPQPPVLADTTVASGWPRRVQALQPAAVARTAPDAVTRLVRLQGSGQAGAFRADWKPDIMGPGTHYGYAIQWFLMATVLAGLCLIASFRKSEDVYNSEGVLKSKGNGDSDD